MSMNQPHTPDGPVTVAELLLALASYPQDATVTIGDPFIDVYVMVGDNYRTVYRQGERAHHYEPPAVEEAEDAPAPRRHAGDDYAAAQDFLEWLRSQEIGLISDEGSPARDNSRDSLAARFAARGGTS